MKFARIEGNEFSRLLTAEQLALLPLDAEISADAEERAALARRLGLLELASLSARLTLSAGRERGELRVAGFLEARATQSCVVTLAPVETRLQEAFEAFFAEPSGAEAPGEAAEAPFDEDREPPEALPPEGLDLGELAAQQLAVALDPYPRAADADAVLQEITAAQDDGNRQSPFDILRGLQEKD